jgi:hypothetical protein
VAQHAPEEVSSWHSSPTRCTHEGAAGARAHCAGKQAELLGGHGRHHGARRCDFLWRPKDGSIQSARIELARYPETNPSRNQHPRSNNPLRRSMLPRMAGQKQRPLPPSRSIWRKRHGRDIDLSVEVLVNPFLTMLWRAASCSVKSIRQDVHFVAHGPFLIALEYSGYRAANGAAARDQHGDAVRDCDC